MMRNILRYKLLLFLLVFAVVGAVNASAQVPTPTRVWNGETNNAGDSNGYWLDPEGDNTYRLANTITVNSNLTLVVKDRAISIRIKGNDPAGAIFDIQNGGMLRIYGAADKRVTLTGAVQFTTRLDASGHYKRIETYTGRGSYPVKGENTNTGNTEPLILCAGGLLLDNVTLTNNFNTRGTGGGSFYHDGGAIHFYNETENTRKITMTNVIIKDCHSENSGGAIHLHGKFSQNINMTNCQIFRCSTRNPDDAQSGGIIRTNGGTNATLIMNNCEAHHNYTHNVGGVMWWNAYGTAGTETSGSATITGNCYFHDNCAYQDGGAIFNAGADLVVQSCKVENNKALQGVGGGIYCRNYVLTGNGQGHLTLGTGCEICNNTAPKGGGVALGLEQVDAEKYTVKSLTMTLDINGAYIHDNTASQSGGGIYMFKPSDLPADVAAKYQNYFHLISGSIINNTAKQNGGGVYIEGGVAENIMSNGTIKNNSAQNGGGMYVAGGTSVVTGGEFSDNKATSGNGGCFDIISGNIEINGGTLKNNTAKIDGGAICVSGGNATIFNGLLSENKAGYGNTSGNGGGFCISSGKIDFKGGTVEKNNAVSNGGGLYVTGGNIILNNGTVTANNAANGGGAFIQNGKITITGGDIIENISVGNGGGVYAGGSSSVSMSDGNIADNQAKNGGGIYLASGADMSMSNGLIRYNKAVSAQGATIPTAYHAGADASIQGVGGGIYLSSGTDVKDTKLTFILPETVGIYGNTATLGADEIFADGLHTQITVPNVEGMRLSEYPATVDGWYEDYITNDTNYTDGTNIAPAGTPVRRYEDYIAKKESPYLVPYTTASEDDKYICLRLGYTPLKDLIISKSGMKEGETAIFKVSKSAAGSPVLYTIPVTAKSNGSGSTTINGLDVGEYTVTEITDWSWAYTPDPASGKITQNIGEKNTFTFKNTPKKDTPPHAEAGVNNKLEKKSN